MISLLRYQRNVNSTSPLNGQVLWSLAARFIPLTVCVLSIFMRTAWVVLLRLAITFIVVVLMWTFYMPFTDLLKRVLCILFRSIHILQKSRRKSWQNRLAWRCRKSTTGLLTRDGASFSRWSTSHTEQVTVVHVSCNYFFLADCNTCTLSDILKMQTTFFSKLFLRAPPENACMLCVSGQTHPYGPDPMGWDNQMAYMRGGA